MITAWLRAHPPTMRRMLDVYTYAKCSTCRKATAFLKARGVPFREIPIRERPPGVPELKRMLAAVGDVKRLFNTSGQDYRALGIKDQLPKLTTAAALALLAGNGNLIKRPFVLAGARGLVGFAPEAWAELG